MTTRSFIAETRRNGSVSTVTGAISSLMDTVDAAVTAASENATIAADTTAAGLVGEIATAMLALRADAEGNFLGGTVTVTISGTPNQNQIALALDNVKRNIAQSSEFAAG